MAKQWKITFTLDPNYEGDRSTLEYVEAGQEFTVDEISLYIGDAVPEYRQVEIFNAWKWLMDGIHSRNLLDEQFKGFPLITGASINALTTTNRRTSSTVGDFNTDDVMIGIGANVSDLGDVLPIDTAFELLRQFALETLKDN